MICQGEETRIVHYTKKEGRLGNDLTYTSDNKNASIGLRTSRVLKMRSHENFSNEATTEISKFEICNGQGVNVSLDFL